MRALIRGPGYRRRVLRDIAPSREGFVERDGLAIAYQVFGSGDRAILLLPTWSIVHTDFWRHQVPHLADRYTVVTFDGLGNGASDRPTDPRFYTDDAFVQDAVAVMDAAGVERAVPMSASMGAGWNLLLADRYPERIAASVYIATDLPLAELPPGYREAAESFDEHLTDHVGWRMWNREFWHQDWEAFCRFFFSRCFTEPDSEIERTHFLSMGVETTPATITATIDTDGITPERARDAARHLRLPSLVIHGDEDAISSMEVSERFATLAGAELIILPGSGHEPQCRIPGRVNELIDAFLADHHPP